MELFAVWSLPHRWLSPSQPLTCTACTSSCFSASSCSRLQTLWPSCSFSLAAAAASSSLLSLSISTWQQHEGDIMWTTLPWLSRTHVPSCNACSRSQAQSLSVLTVHLHVSIIFKAALYNVWQRRWISGKKKKKWQQHQDKSLKSSHPVWINITAYLLNMPYCFGHCGNKASD